MKIVRVKIKNFRGIKECEIFFQDHTALVGDNNTGKSTVLEAMDLVLGPERLSRNPIIDEHDFYTGEYLDLEKNSININIEVVVIDLSDEQKRYFKDHLEWWDNNTKSLITGPPPENTDASNVFAALRVGFTGTYDKEEDDFVGKTYFLSPAKEDGSFDLFGTRDKRQCGFLFLRTLRTGSRALSLERGSLLDIILRLQEKRPQMWENILNQLRQITVAENSELGITDILTSVQASINSFVPLDNATAPHMRVSNLTRENLRRILTVFMGTQGMRSDGTKYAVPFQKQGTGTINMLVLALLSLIAELKQNVIFAMEEPEIAIPPHTQKSIVNSIRKQSAQAIFTSHSPYILEEFNPENLLVITNNTGNLIGATAKFPTTIKPKKYREEYRKRFCEALLSRRVLIAEGKTEYDAFPIAARRLNELHPNEFKSLEALGIAVINAETDTQVAPLGDYFQRLGKTVFAVFDKQETEQKKEIDKHVKYPYEATEKGFENIILNGTPETILRTFAVELIDNSEWPSHLSAKRPTPTMSLDNLKDSLREYFRWGKGAGVAATLLEQCSKDEMPSFIVETLSSIMKIVEPPAPANKSDKESAIELEAVSKVLNVCNNML